MPHEILHDKLFSWLPKNEKLTPFYEGIVDFVEKHVNISKANSYKHPKDILDPCVGYVKLKSWEIAIIDTALFQRLRKITQLGLAYLVYPTLRYSRLEHTIGVIGRLSECLQILKEKHHIKDNPDNKKINILDVVDEYETQIRLAALFHDVGHCIFSHLSEGVIHEITGDSEYPSVKEIREIFNQEFSSFDSNLSIAEVFSITILGVKKIAEVLWESNVDIHQPRNVEKAKSFEGLSTLIHQTARFIAGLPVENDARTIFLAQLISSGLDADKLDYMSREEHFSGIKIEMDLQRIYNKLKLFAISDETDLPKELTKYSKHIKDRESHKDFIVLGIEKGGQFAYEEFCVARLALYEKIYLHKKVRAAEALLRQKLEFLSSSNSEFKKAHNWLFLSESIIERKYEFIETIMQKPKIGELDLSIPVSKMQEINFTSIENREIPYRSFAFGPANAKTDDDISRDSEFGGIEENHLVLDSIRFWNKLNPNSKFKSENPSEVEKFTEMIANEALEILIKINIIDARKSGAVSNLMKLFELNNKKLDDKEKSKITQQGFKDNHFSELKKSIIIDVPDYRRVQLKYDSLNFEEASYQTVRWTIPIDQIARYYQLHRILAYVYSDLKFCALFHLATERVIYNYLGTTKMVFDQSQVIPKNVFKEANEIKSYLAENSDFYKDYEDLLPLNEQLLTVSAKSKINDVIHKLNKHIYFDAKKLTYLDVEQFLKQFDTRLQLPALNMISNIELVGDGTLSGELTKVISQINPDMDENIEIGILPLGNYMSSSSHIMKKYQKFLSDNKIRHLTLGDADSFGKVKHILIIDDNINTGRQALNIMAKMLGIDTSKIMEDGIYLKDIHEQNGEASKVNEDEIIKRIKTTPLTFIFITGHEESELNLKKYLTNYCDISEGNINIIIQNKLKDNDKFFSGGSLSAEEENKPLTLFRKVKDNFKQSPNDIADLKKFLERVGKGVVRSRSIVAVHHQPVEEHCLGYCNRESLVIFPNSVPTMTITALWCSGSYDEDLKQWKALIERPSNKKK
jgi:HD superfamily phosphohydrolase